MIRLTDLNATKTIEVSGVKFVIKPLRRQDHSRIQTLWYEAHTKVPSVREAYAERALHPDDEAVKEKVVVANARLHDEIDQDALAVIMARAIVSIDDPRAHDVVTYLAMFSNDDFWVLERAIEAWTGLDEETANFSDSSLEQPSAAPAQEDVVKNAAVETAPVGATQPQ